MKQPGGRTWPRVLEHLQHAVHRGISPDHALREHGLAGDDTMALDELQGRGMRRLGRRRTSARAAARRGSALAPAPPAVRPDCAATGRARAAGSTDRTAGPARPPIPSRGFSAARRASRW